MSHYLVAVMTPNKPNDKELSEILAPYDEHISVPRYVSKTKQQLIAEERKRMELYKETRYADYLKKPKEYAEHCSQEHLEYISQTFPKLLEADDETIYQVSIKGYPKLDEIEEDSEKTAIDKHGSLTTTYNPKSKWDWWVTGGRFADSIPLKNNRQANCAKCSSIKFGNDIDVTAYIEKHPDIRKKYEKLMQDGDGWYRVEYLHKRYPSLDDYVRSKIIWRPYAIVDLNGEWHEPGEMGWFGCSSATYEDELEWERTFYDKFIKGHESAYLTIVDCHI